MNGKADPNCARSGVPSVDELLQRARGLGFLVQVLDTSPDEDFCAMMSPIRFGGLPTSGYGLMDAFWEEGSEKDMGEVSLELRRDWTRLFRGVSPSYGPPPPYEYVYVSAAGQDPHQLVALTRLYASRGIVISPEERNRADYLGYELAFASLLLEDAANAPDEASRDVALGTFAAFVDDHLGWVAGFCERVQDEAATNYYRGYAQVLRDSMEELSAFAQQVRPA